MHHALKPNIVSMHIVKAMFTNNNIVFYIHSIILVKVRLHAQTQGGGWPSGRASDSGA